LKKKGYTLYGVDGPPKRRWKRIVLWSAVGLLLAILLVAAGSYLWFRAQVSSANSRVTPEVRAVLQEKPSTTLTTAPVAVASATANTVPVKEPSPSAMNLLVIGSDSRSKDASSGGRSDTLMIVHIDPDQNYLSVLSLPRDLRVDIPGHGKGKLDTAFAFGGPALAIKTIEQTTGVDINHYMEIGFNAFSDIVDSLGGVYVDVDKRYYNPDYYYEPIDLYPGYQLLDGANALDYVRFRHDRTMDFGRMERQQRFMAALREQAMGWDLPFKLPGLISSLFSNVATDLDANEIIRLAKWGIGLNGDGIRAISLRGSTPTINGVSYVVATEDQLAHAVDQLLYVSTPDDPTDTTDSTEVAGFPDSTGSTDETGATDGGTTTTLSSYSSYSFSTTTTTETVDVAGITVDVSGASGRTGEAGAAALWLRGLGLTVGTSADDSANTEARSAIEYPSGMLSQAKRVAAATGIDRLTRANVDQITVLLGADFVLPAAFALPPGPSTVPDAELWRQAALEVPYAVQAPSILPDAYVWIRKMPDNQPTYDITVGGGTKPAFRMMYASPGNSDQVMGITETTWLDAPAASKGLEVTHDGVVFTVVRNDTKVERVWWKANGVLYFVSNTLSHWLNQDEMLKVAESMISIPAQ
jgi:polyisoprenyl-teichoic acid--peptidoglycan teichoic acid transferase